MKGEIVGAVDFGSRTIRVLIARQDEGGAIQILGHGTAPARGCVSQGVVQDREAAQMALRSALSAAEKEARIKTRSLFCSINGKNVDSCVREGYVNIEREVIEQEHLVEARDIASRDILAPGKSITSSITAQEWYVDDLRVQNPLGIKGQVLKTRIHFARLPAVIEDNLASCVESQRRELEDLIFAPLAASLGCLAPEDTALGVAVVDIGRSLTGLAVHRDYRILGSHCFEWGGHHITRDVAAALQISFDEADELILEYGISHTMLAREFSEQDIVAEETSPPSDTPRIKLKTAVPGADSTVDREVLDEVIYERAKELLVRIRQHLQGRDLAKHLVPRGVVLTGGASTIKNFVMLAEAVFQVPCRVGKPNSVDVMPHEVESPEYSASVGICRHAFQYRAAARNGHVDGRGGATPISKRLGRFLKRYFF